jgi:hypothetical protein
MFNMCLLLVLCSSAVLAHQIVMDHVGQTLPPYNETGIIKKNFDGETLAFVRVFTSIYQDLGHTMEW